MSTAIGCAASFCWFFHHGAGVDPVRFGVILNLGIDLWTPPGHGDVHRLRRGCIPIWDAVCTIWQFNVAAFGILLIVSCIPALSLWLPSLFR